MTCKKFESVIAYHCSPVLMGMKPSNLVSFSKEKMPELPKLAAFYSENLKGEGICMEIICSCRRHYLVFVYRPGMLGTCLQQIEARKLLKAHGYPEKGTLEEMISYLKSRFEVSEDFPHEIGLFLGYPTEDVEGFHRYGGNECKLCGYWKVYGDVEAARRLFADYDMCREFISAQIQKGYSILQVVGMKHLCKFASEEIYQASLTERKRETA